MNSIASILDYLSIQPAQESSPWNSTSATCVSWISGPTSLFSSMPRWLILSPWGTYIPLDGSALLTNGVRAIRRLVEIIPSPMQTLRQYGALEESFPQPATTGAAWDESKSTVQRTHPIFELQSADVLSLCTRIFM